MLHHKESPLFPNAPLNPHLKKKKKKFNVSGLGGSGVTHGNSFCVSYKGSDATVMGSAKRPEPIQTGLSWEVFALHRLKGRGDAVRDIKASLPSWANTARPFKSSVQTPPVC